MKKTNVVIASVLKPIDDTRMYEKFALTLTEFPNYHIHIIGFTPGKPIVPSHPRITFYPIFNFTRLHIKRFVSPLKYYKLILKLKPDIIIVNSIDLLVVTCAYKILFGAKLLYDVQENNMYNSIYLKKFRRPLNYVFGYTMRFIEILTSPFIHHFILAEKTYRDELFFIGNRFSIVENKYKPLLLDSTYTNKINSRSIYHLLYSGTIAESYGIFEAIELAVKLNQLDSRFHLTIIGFCADANVFAKVKQIVSNYSFICLIGGDHLVSHIDIIKVIQKAGIALLPYQDNKSTNNRIPTKLNEYIYYKLPMLIPHNKLWEAYCLPFKAAMVIDFNRFEVNSLLLTMLSYRFFVSVSSHEPILWEFSRDQFKGIFSNIYKYYFK